MSYRRTSYSTKGLITASGIGLGTAVVLMAINLIAVVWGFYFLFKIAQFVNAWPF